MRRLDRHFQVFEEEYGIRLSTRAKNLLLGRGLQEPEKLAKTSIQEIARFEGAGIKTLDEIRTVQGVLWERGVGCLYAKWQDLSRRAESALFELGYKPGDDLSELSLSDLSALPGVGQAVSEEILNAKHAQHTDIPVPNWSKVEKMFFYDAFVLPLPLRAATALEALNIGDFDAIINLRMSDVLEAPATGPQTYDEINWRLALLRKVLKSRSDATADEAYAELDFLHPSPDQS